MSLLPSSDVSTRLICVCMAFSLRIFLCSDRFEIEHKTQKVVPVGQMGPLDRMTGMSPNGRPSSEPVQKSGRVQSISDCENGAVYLRYIYCISTD